MDQLKEDAKRIYHEWDRALANNDIDALVSLYTPNATIESPLIPYLMKRERGVIHGHAEIRDLVEKVAKRKPPLRKYHRKGFFTDGKTLMFEYPRAAPEGDQMDFVEVMEIEHGLITYHRVYWGWLGFKVIKEDAYYK